MRAHRRLSCCVLLGASLLTAGSAVAAAAAADSAEILHFGAGSESLDVVLRGNLYSVYAVSVPANVVLDYLQELGGPTYSVKEPLSRPVTLTEHRETMEELLRKMLVGYNYVLELRSGRIRHVRVFHMITGHMYKTPPPLETREQWRRIELDDRGD